MITHPLLQRHKKRFLAQLYKMSPPVNIYNKSFPTKRHPVSKAKNDHSSHSVQEVVASLYIIHL